ncbi:hypothetical protein Zm00014a_042133 [Zea mays]|uniref:Uncharacterized protein n=1 Tax=Zea mays TaxID=4577 RepID=A0A317Y3F7_MAIZE|nr:hypothetical protein Zm00014a_042133 [Zea mays]
MAYDCWSCDLLCAASSPDLYRINLEQGRFLASLSSESPAINAVTRRRSRLCNLMKIKDTLWQWGPVQERLLHV